MSAPHPSQGLAQQQQQGGAGQASDPQALAQALQQQVQAFQKQILQLQQQGQGAGADDGAAAAEEGQEGAGAPTAEADRNTAIEDLTLVYDQFKQLAANALRDKNAELLKLYDPIITKYAAAINKMHLETTTQAAKVFPHVSDAEFAKVPVQHLNRILSWISGGINPPNANVGADFSELQAIVNSSGRAQLKSQQQQQQGGGGKRPALDQGQGAAAPVPPPVKRQPNASRDASGRFASQGQASRISEEDKRLMSDIDKLLAEAGLKL